MVYYVASESVYWEQAKRGFMDEGRPEPFHDIPYANPAELELSAPEREHKFTIGRLSRRSHTRPQEGLLVMPGRRNTPFLTLG